MARFRLTGNFRSLGRFANKLAKTKKQLNDISKAMADETLAFTKERFTTQTSPSKRRWKRLAASTLARKRGSEILVDTGDMLASLGIVRLGPRGHVVAIDTPGNFHQSGTSRMPKRQIFPATRGRLPKDLLEQYRRVFQRVLRRHFD